MDIIIYEDEKSDIQRITQIITGLNQLPKLRDKLHIVLVTGNYWEVIGYAEKVEYPCIYLVDITIGDEKELGIKLAEKIKAINPHNKIVYITANLDLLTRNPSGKLLINSYIDKEIGHLQEELKVIFENMSLQLDKNRFFSFRFMGERHFIAFDDIYYFEKEKGTKRLQITHIGGTSSFTGNINSIMGTLDGRFEHCHQSFIVNCEKVIGVAGNRLTGKYYMLSNGDKCPVRSQ